MGSRLHRPSSASTGSSSITPLANKTHEGLLKHPYEIHDGRRFIRNLPYPLPVDLPEQNRQIIHTKLVCEAFDRPICSPFTKHKPPRRILEVACGTGLWSALCAEYLQNQHGAKETHFVGMDIAPQAPHHLSQPKTNKSETAMKWTFIQHDLRRLPWPFDDHRFDFVMLKDVTLVLPGPTALQLLVDESTRILQPGGCLEIWAADSLIRAMQPHPPLPPGVAEGETLAAQRSAMYLIAPGTPFAPAQNSALAEANGWIAEGLEARGFSAAPCARIESALYQEVDKLREIGSRRVAVPFAEMRWERRELLEESESDDLKQRPKQEQKGKQKQKQKAADSVLPPQGKDKALLTPDQAALRRAALLSHLMMIESLEGLLQEASGMKREEWASWWSSMMGELLDPSASSAAKGVLIGECLEAEPGGPSSGEGNRWI